MARKQPAPQRQPAALPYLGETIRVLAAPGRSVRHPVTGVPLSHATPTAIRVDLTTLARLRDGDLLIQ